MSSPAPVVWKSSFFRGLATRDVQSILGVATPRRFFANSVVFTQGDRARSLYLLAEGCGRHFFITPEGQKIVLTSILPGELFGSAALIPSMNSYLVSVEALKNSWVLTWDTDIVKDLTARHPLLLHNGGSLMARYVGLACHSAQLRLAEILISLSSDIGRNGRNGIEFAVTNEELANAANVTLFTVSRLMREWHRCGVLRKSRGKVLLRSPEQLLKAKSK
jgi:CRP/FNR family transcriptional regulator, nitrogen oxide reductase regulator